MPMGGPHHTPPNPHTALTLGDGVAVERAGGRPAALGAVEGAVAQVAAHGAAPVCKWCGWEKAGQHGWLLILLAKEHQPDRAQ